MSDIIQFPKQGGEDTGSCLAMPVQRHAAPDRDHRRTLDYAWTALGQIDSLQLPADPPSFEVWYAYASGHNPALNAAINDLFQRNGTVAVEELDALHERFLSVGATVRSLGTIGGKVRNELEAIIRTLNAALLTASDYSRDLRGAKEGLAGPADADGLRAAVTALLAATEAVQERNLSLEHSLQSSRQQIEQLQDALDTVHVESLTDALTKLANRRYFDERIKTLAADSKKAGMPMSLLICDVDHFKSFNDRYGHPLGDHVLKLIATNIKQAVRGQGVPARFGGEEFAVILPEAQLHQAVALGESIRRNVMQRPLVRRNTGESLGRVTVSIGAAELWPTDSVQALIERADQCLYAAKRAGRNRVVGELFMPSAVSAPCAASGLAGAAEG